MRGGDYFIPATAMGLALAARLPALVQGWRSPMVRSVCALIAMGATGWFFAAPPVVARVNRLTGVPNFSAPLVYCIVLGFSCASLVLIIHWRGGPAETVRRHVLGWILGTVAAAAILAALFALGDAPVERRRDFDTYYANTPFVREMIVWYLLAHTATATVVSVTCWRWAAEVSSGWVRYGLRTLVTGFAFNLAFGVLKGIAVAARWLDSDLDVLSTSVAPPVGSIGAGLGTCGFLMPLVGPRLEEAWRAWRSYRRMYPLWRALYAHPEARSSAIRLPWWAGIELRATQRATQVADGIHDLSPYIDPAHRPLWEEQAAAAGCAAHEVDIAADARMVRAALRAREDRQRHGSGEEAPSPADLHVRLYVGGTGHEWFGRLGAHFARLDTRGEPLGAGSRSGSG
ncbi:MAB_1171c family putative transporter [Streptomyces sp. NPDC046876]|uniref:MAB_1171c family putative transporter n=1 Tax=Streptomyces sp. NPDC046876 TaxID=3155616 RepID=UPI0033C62C24